MRRSCRRRRPDPPPLLLRAPDTQAVTRTEFAAYSRERRDHWDDIAHRRHRSPRWGGYYHRRLAEILAHHIAPGQRVLELGCGTGDLLAALRPAGGVGV